MQTVRLLLDEDVPVQLLEPLRRLLPGHKVDHVQGLGWKGKPDHFLLADAAARGYDVLVTNDSGQMDSPKECRDIRDSGIHHTRYRMLDGLDGLALAMGAVLAAIRPIVRELASVGAQRLVVVQGIAPGKRHTTVDPAVDPPRYWPTRAGQPVRPRAQRSALKAPLNVCSSARPNWWARTRGWACRQAARSPPGSVPDRATSTRAGIARSGTSF